MKKFLLTRLGRDSFIHKPITRNLSFQNNWDGSHILYRKKTIPENVQFIQEKYFEFSWNLANIYFITVHINKTKSLLDAIFLNVFKCFKIFLDFSMTDWLTDFNVYSMSKMSKMSKMTEMFLMF